MREESRRKMSAVCCRSFDRERFCGAAVRGEQVL